MTCASSVTVKAHYSCSLQTSQVKIIVSWLSRQGGIYKSLKKKEPAQLQHGIVDMLKFKRMTLLIHMPKLEPLKLHFFLRINSLSHSLKPKQLLRSILYNCGKNHGQTTTQAVTFMIFSQWFQWQLTEACMEGKQNLKSNRLKTGHSLVKQTHYDWQSNLWLWNLPWDTRAYHIPLPKQCCP